MRYSVIHTENAPIPIGPYVQAINTGNIVFISGQIGICPDTKNISDDIYQQTQQTLQNIKQILITANLEVHNIIKTTIFITNINNLPEINKSYAKFFKNNSICKNTQFPTRSCVEISRLPKNANIEIEAIAMRY